MTRSLSAIVVAVLVALSSAAPAWAQAPEAPGRPKPMPPLRKAGWLTLGAGGGLVAGSAVLFVMAANDYSTFSQTPERHDRQDQAASDAFVREFRAAKILCAVGVLAVGTGLTLVLISTPRDEVRVTAGLGQLGLSGRF